MYPLNRRNQTVTAFCDGLNDAGVFRIILKGSTELSDRAFKYIVTYEGVGPDGLQQLFLCDRFAGVLGQAHQNLHCLRREVVCRPIADGGIQTRMDQPRP
jgi:hypothetical protein